MSILSPKYTVTVALNFYENGHFLHFETVADVSDVATYFAGVQKKAKERNATAALISFWKQPL